jgi:hypothetical protein
MKGDMASVYTNCETALARIFARVEGGSDKVVSGRVGSAAKSGRPIPPDLL